MKPNISHITCMLGSGYNWVRSHNVKFLVLLCSGYPQQASVKWTIHYIRTDLTGVCWVVRRSRPSHNIPGHNDTFWWPFIKSVWLHTKLYHHAGNVKWKLSPHSTPSYQPSVPIPSLHYTQCSPLRTKMSHWERESSHSSIIENVWHMYICQGL